MEFRLLGPLEVRDASRPLSIGGPKQRVVLAHLLLRANQIVSADDLIDVIWEEDPPDAARGTLQAYVSRLRKTLGPDRLETRSRGYVLHADPLEVDVLRFESLIERARRSVESDPGAAVRMFREGLAMWEGPPLTDLADQPSLRPDIARLEELRLAAVEERVGAQLRLGRHSELIPELEGLTAKHPLRERLWGHFMVALYRSGRQADALGAYQRARHVLAEELGIDPSPDLQRLQARILGQDPTLELRGEPLRGYRLIEQIGEGAFGAVYRAYQPQLGREVAVKVIHPRLANKPEFILRFESEAQLVARLEHPHIVPLYDYWREPDGAYLVMRLLPRGNLRATIATGPLDPSKASVLVDQISLALAAGHRQGVIHRDVKPANILFDADGNAYLSDFGIAKEAASPEGPLVSSTPSGFLQYLSPEEIRGEQPTQRTDLYSLGLILYEVLVGHHPFADAPPETLPHKHLEEPVPSVRLAHPDLPPATDEVIQRATAKDPKDRYPDALTLAEAFRSAVTAPTAEHMAPPPMEVRNPYKGLRPFLAADADDFFGREPLIERLLVRMAERSERSRFLAIVGPSGSGKSSLVRAGLIPALRRGALPGSDRWFVVEMVPGDRPFDELERSLLRVAANPPPPGLREQLERDATGLLRATKWLLPNDGSELVLLIDQFEELYTLVSDDVQRSSFLASLIRATTEVRSRVRVVIALRADFYDRPLEHKQFGELLASRTQAITPLSAEEFERALSRPAERAGVAIEHALEAEIISEVADEPGALPLFQYAITELFEQRDDAVLTLEAYRSIGGVSGAIARRAEQLYEELSEEDSEAARQLFLRLVAVSDEGTEVTRRRVLRSELRSIGVEGGGVDGVIDAFGAHRLLSFDRDPVTRGPMVEVAHEALLAEWPRLRGWLESAREDIRMHRRLGTAAAEWRSADRDPSFLLRGGRLAQFATWAPASGLALSAAERDYLDASLHQDDAERAAEEARKARETALERRSLSRLRTLVAALTTFAVLVSGLTIMALGQRNRARQQTNVALARELAASAVANMAVDPERAILLAMEAVRSYRSARVTPGRDAVEALHQAVQKSRVVLAVTGSAAGVDFSPDGRIFATAGAVWKRGSNTPLMWNAKDGTRVRALTGARAPANNDVTFNDDGSRLATVHGDGTAIVWDVPTGQRAATIRAPEEQLLAADFSPDGTRLATTGPSALRVWDVRTGNEILAITGPPGHATCTPDFSPDGSRIVTGFCFGAEGAAVFDTETGKQLLRLQGHSGDVFDVAYSPDGARLMTAGLDGTAKIWNASTGRQLFTLEGHTGWVVGADFSPDGRLVATGSSDATARVWDARSGRELLVLSGHTETLGDVSFSPNGSLLLTGSDDGTARIWDVTVQGGREALTIASPSGPEGNVSYSPDGTLLVTTGAGGTVQTWDAGSGRQLETLVAGGDVFDAALAPDGTHIAAISSFTQPPVVTIWNRASGRVVHTLRPATKFPWLPAVSFSPNGRLLASTGADGAVTLWDTRAGTQVRVFQHSHLAPPLGAVYRASFSPEGTHLATAGWDGTARIWDVTSGSELVTLSAGQRASIYSANFSNDGRRLVTAVSDGTARVWDLASGEQSLTLAGHSGVVRDARFSPDGRLVATAGEDTTARLWDASTGKELLKLTGHLFTVNELAFSPDGSRLATASRDGTVQVRLLRLGELMNLARERVTRSLTNEECRVFLHLQRCP